MDAARGDVGGDEDLDGTVLHATQRALALGLGAVTVQGYGRDAALTELAREAVGAVLGAGEDDRSLVLLNDVGGDLGTTVSRYSPEVVVDVARRFVAHDVVNRGVVGELAHQRRHVRSHRGGKQHDVALARGGRDDTSHRGQEPHVGHTVGFVNDDGGDVAEVESALFEHVFEAPGTGDHDVDAEVERLARDVIGGTAVDADDAATLVVGQLGNLFLDLSGQFTRRNQHQSGGFARTGLGEIGEQGEGEGEGLARTGDRLTYDVATRQGVGNRRLLDGERFGDTARAQTFDKACGDAEVGKGHRHRTPTS